MSPALSSWDDTKSHAVEKSISTGDHLTASPDSIWKGEMPKTIQINGLDIDPSARGSMNFGLSEGVTGHQVCLPKKGEKRSGVQ